MPISLVKFLRSLDQWLVEKDRSYLEVRTQNLAAAISPFIEQWFTKSELVAHPVFPLNMVNTPILDGYDSEWNANPANWLDIGGSNNKFLVAKNKSYIYLYILFPGSGEQSSHSKYELKFFAKDEDNLKAEQHSYKISPEAPGKIVAMDKKHHFISRIQGYWQKDSQRETLELRIPQDLFAPRFQLIIKFNQHRYASQLMQILKPEKSQQQFLKWIHLNPGEKIWLLGSRGEVLGFRGELTQQTKYPANFLLTWLIGSVPNEAKDPWSGRSQINIIKQYDFQSHQVYSEMQPGLNANQKRIIAVAKLKTKNTESGYILFEKVSGSSLLLSQPQVGTLINVMMIILILTIVSLFYFVGKISLNIRYLKKQFSNALNEEGRVNSLLPPSSSHDEIGILSRNINQNLQKQKNFQDYKERLASRLSHELRTPLAIVRGSLDNLLAMKQTDNCPTSPQMEFIDRAVSGIDRMSGLITRMREASALEQSINFQPKQAIELKALLMNSIPGFQSVWPEHPLEFKCELTKIITHINPELFIQGLEKVLSNAMDFSKQGAKVLVSLSLEPVNQKDYAVISISNLGPTLPENEEDLFDNLVSIRVKNETGQLHLGLGLHIARLIAQFHQGFIKINNLEQENGVMLSIYIPVLPQDACFRV